MIVLTDKDISISVRISDYFGYIVTATYTPDDHYEFKAYEKPMGDMLVSRICNYFSCETKESIIKRLTDQAVNDLKAEIEKKNNLESETTHLNEIANAHIHTKTSDTERLQWHETG